MMEGPIALAALTQQVPMVAQPTTHLKLKFLLTLRPQRPIRMRIRR